ncbi:MAG TPA: transglutaminase-like domain-containing protein [Methylomirabilota bacterium]|jgi:transglutaminase-like putative cysteine protease
MERREFLRTTALTSAAASFARLPAVWASSTTDAHQWRAFEVTTRVEILNATGVTRAWVPLPLGESTDYQKTLGRTWSGNATSAQVATDPRYGAGYVVAAWPEGMSGPVLEVVSRIATRDRQVNVSDPATGAAEDPAVLRRYLEASELIPTDGIVEATAREITKTAKSDGEKARALYEWIVDNTFRDPKVKGCGLGDIQTMLETKNLGGKCADLNALFVGFARSVGIPARDVYGVRVADSASFKCLGKSGDITKAQHCRAEFYLTGRGWVPVDPADVRKVVLEERPGGLPLDDPQVQRARAKLFGAWEMNWMAYNYAHDVKLPGSPGAPVPFLMYPQAETGDTRRDSLDPDQFRYTIKSREIAL